MVLIMLLVVLSAGSLNLLGRSKMSESRKLLLMRTVGHQLLRSSGDSSSRVMPVRKFSEEAFLIEFENEFKFSPDSLVSIVKKTIANSDFPANYSVDVMRCFDQLIIYNYEITPSAKDIACLGRVQPSGCYAVQITFHKSPEVYDTSFLGGLALIGATVIGFVAFRQKRKTKEEPPVQNDHAYVAIGSFKFYPELSRLDHATENCELSRKETMVLKLFAENLNQLLPRERLLKEIWEDEGVITGRSLDMFVSKLRKKLKHDPAVNLVNVHGKGYRLEA